MREIQAIWLNGVKAKLEDGHVVTMDVNGHKTPVDEHGGPIVSTKFATDGSPPYDWKAKYIELEFYIK